MRSLFWPVALLAVLTIPVGCGPGAQSNRPSVVPAEGVVTYKGQPLANATVTLVPTSGKYAASGKTDASGHFVLRAFQDQKGAVPGEYKVAIRVSQTGEDVSADQKVDYNAPPKENKSPIPEKYTSASTSGLTVKIPPEGNKNIKIELQ